MIIRNFFLGTTLAIGVAALNSIQAQTYTPQNWVDDPYSTNANFSLSGATGSNPTYTDNGTALGNLFGNSAIGSTLTLANAGDSITYSGQFALGGNVNVNGNVQFRVGLYYRGGASTDTGWLGYMISNPTGAGGGGLYLRNSPNTSTYGSGTGTTQPAAGSFSYTSGWGADTYNFSLTVRLLTPTTTVMNWTLDAGTLNYFYSGSYTNASASTVGGLSFDQVGFLAGSSTFSSASASDTVSFINPTVTFTPAPEPATYALAGIGMALMVGIRRRK